MYFRSFHALYLFSLWSFSIVCPPFLFHQKILNSMKINLHPEILSGNSFLFDETRDSQRVVSGLTVDLTEALESGIVRDSGQAMDSNDISDPSAIVGRVSDVFDALDAERAIRKYGKKAKVSVTPSEPSSAAPAAASNTPGNE